MGCGGSKGKGGVNPADALAALPQQDKATSTSVQSADPGNRSPAKPGKPEVVIDVVEKLLIGKRVRGSIVMHSTGLGPPEKAGLQVGFASMSGTPLTEYRYHPTVNNHAIPPGPADVHSLTFSPGSNDVEVFSYVTELKEDVISVAISTAASQCGNYIQLTMSAVVKLPQPQTAEDMEIEVPLPAGAKVHRKKLSAGSRVETKDPQSLVWAQSQVKPGDLSATIEVKLKQPNAGEEVRKLRPSKVRKFVIAWPVQSGFKVKFLNVPENKQCGKSVRYITCVDPAQAIQVQTGAKGLPVEGAAPNPSPRGNNAVPAQQPPRNAPPKDLAQDLAAAAAMPDRNAPGAQAAAPMPSLAPAPVLAPTPAAPTPVPAPTPTPAPAPVIPPPAAPGGGSVLVKVRPMKGEVHELTCQLTDTLESLRSTMQSRTGEDAQAQRFIFKGKPLEPGKPLSEYVPAGESTITLTWLVKKADNSNNAAPAPAAAPTPAPAPAPAAAPVAAAAPGGGDKKLSVKIVGGSTTEVEWIPGETSGALKARMSPSVNMAVEMMEVVAKGKKLSDDTVLESVAALQVDAPQVFILKKKAS
mmetsp:Transcript_38873/g.91514  ORF Transcript_38873/g.91514 Transcript_38873/m.91514 type:complete len:582 (-) Transcript_38873:133-1878(-)